MAFYAAWADSYDADLIDAYGYMAPADAVAALIAPNLSGGALARDARILDAGCGTGQAGALLAAAGYGHVDGADLSPEMRAVAARRGVYRALYELDMTADYAPQLAAALGTGIAPVPVPATPMMLSSVSACSAMARRISRICRGSWTPPRPARRCWSR